MGCFCFGGWVILGILTIYMNIRPIESDDYKHVEQIIKDALLKKVSEDYSKSAMAIMLDSDPFQPFKTRDNRDYFVICDNDVIQGIIGKKDNMVKTFFVNPKFHGKGIGTQLLSYIENLIKESGYTLSTVYSTITAKSFYEKNGYVVINTDEKKIPDGALTRYYMEKQLSK